MINVLCPSTSLEALSASAAACHHSASLDSGVAESCVSHRGTISLQTCGEKRIEVRQPGGVIEPIPELKAYPPAVAFRSFALRAFRQEIEVRRQCRTS